jgi:SsrA-binding protein
MSGKTKKKSTKDESKKEFKVVCDNRRARYEFEILEVLQTGIELQGTEVKSLRMGKANLQDSFARIENGELYLYNMHISPYDFGNRFNHDPVRKRKLLVHKGEIFKLNSKVKEKGLTLVPLKIYFKRNWVKLDLALAKGKHLHDKRESIAKRDVKREISKLIKSSY